MPDPRPKPPAGSIKATFPGFIAPALATSIGKVPNGERWVHEIKQERCNIAFGRSWTGEWRPYGLTKQAEQFRYLLLRPEHEAQPRWTHHETLSVDKQSEIYPFLNIDSRKEWHRRGQHLKRKLPALEG
jgi:hypothetical protein